jgi:hypothetical protein
MNEVERERHVYLVLDKLGVDKPAVRDLFIPGIRGHMAKGMSIDDSVKFFRPHWEERKS